MRRVVVGTAGHIDHGKTTLVEALTGIDCDRFAEEKSRGITIDLGFAWLDDELDGEPLQVGFVDVPGHERFLHNALAGLGGIRLMMLVVAADEGIKPQTEEHLAICSLLGIPAGLVALTKTDLVADDLLELAQLELEEALEGTPFEGAPILPVSARTGAGVPELRARLLELASAVDLDTGAAELPARLPIDRAFHLKGLGVVVTGTLMTGTVEPGSTLEHLPSGASARIRSVQVHGRDRDRAVAGERTSLQISGLDLESVERGQTLAAPEAYETSRSLLVRLRAIDASSGPAGFQGGTAAAFQGFVPIRFHLLASECVGRLRPLMGSDGRIGSGATIPAGAEGLAEVRLDRPITAVRGDRFIVRRPSPQTTLGGGEVLDPRWLRRRGASLERALAGLAGDDDQALVSWIESSGAGGIELERLARRLGRSSSQIATRLEALRDAGRILEAPSSAGRRPRFIVPAVWETLRERAARSLEKYFGDHKMTHGLPKAEALRRIAPGRATLLADVYLSWLERDEIVIVRDDLVDLPGRGSGLSDKESRLVDRIVEAFAAGGLTPGSPADLGRELGVKPQIFDGLVKYLIQGGRLARIGDGLVIARSSLDRLENDLRATGWTEFGVPEFKDRFGLSRKWAIPLLESLDQRRVTRRQGNSRVVLPPTH